MPDISNPIPEVTNIPTPQYNDAKEIETNKFEKN
jgi:hypothetical protein